MDKSNSKMYINEYGTKIYKNSKGKIHKEDGPAIEFSDRDKAWYKEGKCHRDDGPAYEFSDGDKEWFILHKKLEEKEFNSWIIRILKFIWIKQKCI